MMCLRSWPVLWFVVLLLAAAKRFGAADALVSIHESPSLIYGPFADGYVPWA